MADDDWKIANSVAVSSAHFFAYRLCAALVARNVLDRGTAADLLNAAAQDVRASTQSSDAEIVGEAVAKGYEQCAVWLSGASGRLS
jgi:hypothetical protein